jgi:hypothetical protein
MLIKSLYRRSCIGCRGAIPLKSKFWLKSDVNPEGNAPQSESEGGMGGMRPDVLDAVLVVLAE